MAWGNEWIAVALVILVLIAWIVWRKPARQLRIQRKEYLVTIEGIVTKVLEDDTDRRGGKHQRMLVRVTKVLDNPDRANVDRRQDVLIAIRYGDRDGFPQREKALDNAAGKRIEIRGRYIPKENGNGNRAVIHFTHQPVGYVRLDQKTYR